jgi:topoisomerase IA-like protein
VVGDHPEGGVVKAGIGRFGPYVEYNGKFKSLKEDDPIDIEIQRAIELLNQAKESTGRPARKFTKSTKKTTKVAKKTKKK